MSETLTWEQPPAPAGGATVTTRYDDMIEQLVARPGDWARVPERLYTNATSIASNIRSGTLRAFAPKGSFEVATRSGVVYVRYVGTVAARRIA